MDPEQEKQPIFSTGLFRDSLARTPSLPVLQQLTVVAVILLAIFSTGYIPKLVAQYTEAETELTQLETTITTNPQASEEAAQAFADITLTAQAAFVFDVLEQRPLYEKAADQQLPLASITKLMTALVAHEIISNQTPVSVSTVALYQDGESGLALGEDFTLESLSDLTLISSSNDGAFAMAAAAGAVLDEDAPAKSFVQAMNIRADELGLTQTYFLNPTGLDESTTKAGAYGSARDVATLMEYILEHQPAILEETTHTTGSYRNESGLVHEAQNTNQFVDDIPGLIGSKTGYTTLAGGNLAVAFDAGLDHPVIAVVLGSSYNNRFYDILNLVEATRNALQ